MHHTSPNIAIQTHHVFILCRSGATIRNDTVPLADVLSAHMQRELSRGDSNHSIISVRRKYSIYLWEDSMVQFLKRSFDPQKSIRVIFHGKEAADGGGP